MRTQFHGEKHGPFRWVFDTKIHRKSNYSGGVFLDKLQCVKAIRCRPTFSLSWYVRTEEEWASWDVAWNIANKHNFDGMDFVTEHSFVFGLSFPESLLNWLSSIRLAEAKDTVIQAMRSLYMEQIKEGGTRLEVDHKVPVSQGGTNDDENLWALCMDCNRGKGIQTVLS